MFCVRNAFSKHTIVAIKNIMEITSYRLTFLITKAMNMSSVHYSINLADFLLEMKQYIPQEQRLQRRFKIFLFSSLQETLHSQYKISFKAV